MTSTDSIVATVIQLVRANLNDNTLEITPQTRPADVPGWDSIKMVDIILDCEDAFDIRLSAADLESFDTVSAMIAAIEAQVSVEQQA